MNETNQVRDDDSLLDEFFAEIENLKIRDEIEDSEVGARIQAESKSENKRTEIFNHTQTKSRRQNLLPQKHEQQKSMIDRAENTRSNWKKFVIQEAPPSSISATGRKPISFSIGAGAIGKKKKKNEKGRPKVSRHGHQETTSTTISLVFGDETTSSSTSMAQPKGELLPLRGPDCLLLPQWIAVLDTCALLESYESVRVLIKLANDAAASALGAPNSNHFSSTSTSFCEALSIVVPYTVWDELDYRSKVITDENEKYKARRAARMLNDELRQQHEEHEWNQSIGNSFDLSTIESHAQITPSIRSQSRIESHRAVEEFVVLSTAFNEGIIANDDKILACALWEQARLAKSRAQANASRLHIPATAAGGVVLITSDKVLTGKARADHLSVYAPLEFVRYYTKRMTSLRTRSIEPTG